jgi:hypothetical protein
VTTTAAAAGTRRYTGTFPAEAAEVRRARAAIAALPRGCPFADDAILVASELATNSVRHGSSRDGGEFTLRAEIRPATSGSRSKTPAARGVTGRATTAARRGSMS